MSSILEEIETKIAGLKTSTTKSNVGVVRETGDGVARIEGLSDVMLNEMIEFPNGDCVFYDRVQGCTVYPVRPRQCRTFPFWESNVETPRAWEQTCQACPGAGKGDLISAEEIAERLKVIHL